MYNFQLYGYQLIRNEDEAIPSGKTIYLMAGAYATEQIASNDRVQKIGSDVLAVIEQKLTELKKNVSEKKEPKANTEG